MKQHKYAIDTLYKGYRFRSRLEARWAYFFDQIGVDYQYEVEGYELPGTRYLPDFLVSLRGYERQWNIFIEIKPEYPSEEDQYKAQWLANYTQTIVYIFYSQFHAPTPENVSAIRFFPMHLNLQLLPSPCSHKIDTLHSFYLSRDLELNLLQLYSIGCQLVFETPGDGTVKRQEDIKIGCYWKNAIRYHFPAEPSPYLLPSPTFPALEETIQTLHLYNKIQDKLKEEIQKRMTYVLASSTTLQKTARPLQFLIQFTEQPSDKGTHTWKHCASCKSVGIYPHDFSHHADCLTYYVKDDKGRLIEPDEPDEKNYQIRQNYYFNKSKKIQNAYNAARAVRFEFGETP